MEHGGTRREQIRWGRLIIILVIIGSVIGGIAACQAARMASPEYQCRDRGDTWVEGYGVPTPYCVHPTPIKRGR